MKKFMYYKIFKIKCYRIYMIFSAVFFNLDYDYQED